MSALKLHGLHENAAAAVARNITDAERDGAHSHGIFRLPGYCASLRSGKVDGSAMPEVRCTAPACVAVDAKGGFSTPAMLAGRLPLVEKAREHGIAMLVIERAFHFAALWPDVEPLASEHGLLALAFLNSKAFIAHAPGGTNPIYGTNPMAFACPRGLPDGGLSREPFVFDQASAAMARGDMMMAARDGKQLPLGFGLDASGSPTCDPGEALQGAQLPFAGHKGTAIALMIELLAATLSGDQFAFEATATDNNDGGPTKHGEIIIAIDPARGEDRPRFFLSRVETLFRQIEQEAVAAAAAGQTLRLPSQRRYDKRRLTPSLGIEVPEVLWAECQRLAEARSAL